MDRRSFLATLAVGTSAVCGCLFASDGPPPGSLVIHSRADTTHTVTVRVEKTSTESDDTGRADQTPAPDTTPLEAWEAEFTVESGVSRREEGFFTDPGAYFVEGSLASEGKTSYWFELPRNSEGGLGEKYLSIGISEQGRVTMSEAGP